MEAAKGIVELVKSNWNGEEKQKHLKRKFNELTAIKKDINNQLEMAESQPGKKRKNEVENWLVEVGRVEDEFKNFEAEMREAGWRSKFWGERVQSLSKEVCELIGNSRFQGGLVLDVCETKAESLPVTKLVGGAFQANLEKIWALLMEDEVSSIGIYGMGGVGKTTLVKHIYNQLLERQSTFGVVYWITVSQDFSIHKLQDHIANAIKFDLCSENEIIRAAELFKELEKKQKSVIILDDLWNKFSWEEIGIPKGCKLIMTTRSLEICRMMSCDEKIKLEPLSEKESFYLFVEKLGNYPTLPLEVKEIARSVVQECDGLPLGIVTLARSMREVYDVMEWRSVLEHLKQSIIKRSETDDWVFRVLNLSYERLRDSVLQECFLYCALFPEDYVLGREELIEYLISEDIIKNLNSRQTQLAKGHAMLNKLENACLLESCPEPYSQCVKMHDLIRDMAINKMKGNPKAMVEAGKRLKGVPDVIEWSKDLERVSLMENYIKEIPEAYSPSCPNLSTLLLCRNRNLEFIADSFFLQFCGLKILDLSDTAIKVLPDSVSNLVSLTSLLLRECGQLCYIPSLATLKTLKKLDLFFCVRVEVVCGLELLSNLQYLDMYGTGVTDIPDGLIQNLQHLQYLRLPWSIAVKVKSGCLGKVEFLECRVPNPHHFYSMMMDHHQRPLPRIFRLLIGELNYAEYSRHKQSKSSAYRGCNIGKDGDFSLDNSFLADGAEVVIHRCEGLEYLISLSGSFSPNIFDQVMTLRLGDLNKLKDLISRDGAPSESFLPGGIFSCLKCFYMWECPSVTCVFPYELLPNFQNLEEITVVCCEKMEQIIGEESNSSSYSSHTEFITLPKLRSMEFQNLPELKSICRKKMACDSLETIIIRNCPKLKRNTLSYPA